MTANKLFSSTRILGIIVFLVICTLSANAQYLRTSYFMEGSHYRMQMNPALTPTKGYFNLPVVGSFNATVSSGTFSYQDVLDIMDNSSGFYSDPKFMNRLKDNNNLNVNVSTEILSAGWYKGQNFWSFNIGLRTDIGAKLTKSMFQFLNVVDKMNNNSTSDWNISESNISGQQLNINAFTEVGLGYAREINSRLTVGGKVKVLLGIGNMELKINNTSVMANLPNETRVGELKNMQITDMSQIDELKSEIGKYKADVVVNASLKSSFKGLDLVPEKGADGQDYISDFDFDSGKLGIAGYGFGIDLGASYKVMDNLTVSASILDLGFISWSKGSTKMATSNGSFNMYGQTYVDQFNAIDPVSPTALEQAQTVIKNFSDDAQGSLNRISSGDILDYEMLQLKEEKVSESRKSRLASTFVVGAEYGLLDNKLGVGVLSTTRFIQPKALTELTFSANYRPKSWFNVALSYSVIQAAGKTFGLGVKVGPVFLGTDYMFLGKNSNSVNGFLGISIPLGAKKTNKQG